jgi:hypothetical protein
MIAPGICEKRSVDERFSDFRDLSAKRERLLDKLAVSGSKPGPSGIKHYVDSSKFQVDQEFRNQNSGDRIDPCRTNPLGSFLSSGFEGFRVNSEFCVLSPEFYKLEPFP